MSVIPSAVDQPTCLTACDRQGWVINIDDEVKCDAKGYKVLNKLRLKVLACFVDRITVSVLPHAPISDTVPERRVERDEWWIVYKSVRVKYERNDLTGFEFTIDPSSVVLI